MKIAVHAGFLSERPTGVGVFTQEAVGALSALEPNLVVLTALPTLFRPGVTCLQTPTALQGSLAFGNNFLRFLHEQVLLPRLLRHLRADALYCPILEFPFGLRLPTVVTVHDLHPILFPRQFGASGLHFRLALRVAVRRRLPILVPSRYVQEQVRALFPEAAPRLTRIELGYDRDRYRPQPEAERTRFLAAHGLERPYLLFVGSLFPYKNLAVLLAAFRRIRDRVAHDLVVVGRTEVAPKRPRCEPRVHYFDYVPAGDLPKFYAYADLHVQPSLAEGFGLTLVEAMACGTPVLASRAGSLPEVLDDAGSLFDPGNPDELTDKMLAFLCDSRLRRELAGKGRKRAIHFDWARCAAAIAAAIRRAVPAGA